MQVHMYMCGVYMQSMSMPVGHAGACMHHSESADV